MRLRHVAFGTFTVVVGMSLATPASALRPEVSQALELYSDLHYDRARQSFLAALALEGNQPDDVATIYLHLGILEGAQNDESAAEEYFRHALEVDPSATLPESLPPKITEPFERARRFWRDARLHVVHTPPEQWVEGHPAVLRFEIADDQMDMVSGARLHVWPQSNGEDASSVRIYSQNGVGPFDFPIPQDLLIPDDAVCYAIELLGATSSVLIRNDEMGAPGVTVVEAPDPQRRFDDRRVGTPPSQTDPQPPPPPPVYRRWWFWTIIGLVVTGAVVGAVVGVYTQGEGVEFGRPIVVR